MCDNQLTVSSLFNCFGALLLLKATAPGLEDKLGKLAPAHAVAGHIAPYLVDRLVEVYLFVYTFFFFSFFFCGLIGGMVMVFLWKRVFQSSRPVINFVDIAHLNASLEFITSCPSTLLFFFLAHQIYMRR